MKQAQQIDSLTSLRFFAALAVAIFHVPYTMPSVWSVQSFPYGATGVSFFFVLSGFILSHAHPLDKTLSVNRFYVKRFARIYPLHITTFFVWSLIYLNTWGGVSRSDVFNSGLANVMLLQAFFAGPVFNLGFNAVSWSLSVEGFFYLIFPLLRDIRIALLWVLAHLLIATALSSATVTNINDAVPSFFYFDPLARTAEFAIGILSYRVFRANPLLPGASWLEVAALALVVVAEWQVQSLRYLLQYPFLGMCFAVMIVIMAQQRGLLSRFLCHPILVLLGEASFSFYMVHHMCFRLMETYLGGHISGFALLATALVATALLSIALLFFIERPMQRLILSLRRPVALENTPGYQSAVTP